MCPLGHRRYADQAFGYYDPPALLEPGFFLPHENMGGQACPDPSVADEGLTTKGKKFHYRSS